jgi:hypothetical protein
MQPSNPFTDERLHEMATRAIKAAEHAGKLLAPKDRDPDIDRAIADLAYISGMLEGMNLILVPPDDLPQENKDFMAKIKGLPGWVKTHLLP